MFRYGRTDKISQGWFSTSHFFMSNNLVGTTHHLNTRHLNTHLVKGHYSDDSMIHMSVIQIPTVLSKNSTVTQKLGGHPVFVVVAKTALCLLVLQHPIQINCLQKELKHRRY